MYTRHRTTNPVAAGIAITIHKFRSPDELEEVDRNSNKYPRSVTIQPESNPVAQVPTILSPERLRSAISVCSNQGNELLRLISCSIRLVGVVAISALSPFWESIPTK